MLSWDSPSAHPLTFPMVVFYDLCPLLVFPWVPWRNTKRNESMMLIVPAFAA